MNTANQTAVQTVAQSVVSDLADTIYVRSTVTTAAARPGRDEAALAGARGYFQSSADLARGLEIQDSPLGTLSPELIREFLQLRAERRRGA